MIIRRFKVKTWVWKSSSYFRVFWLLLYKCSSKGSRKDGKVFTKSEIMNKVFCFPLRNNLLLCFKNLNNLYFCSICVKVKRFVNLFNFQQLCKFLHCKEINHNIFITIRDSLYSKTYILCFIDNIDTSIDNFTVRFKGKDYLRS